MTKQLFIACAACVNNSVLQVKVIFKKDIKIWAHLFETGACAPVLMNVRNASGSVVV